MEHRLGFNRGEIDGIDGYAAVLLWHKYDQTGEERYLHTLLAYNVEDVVNLELLLPYAYNGLVEQEMLPFDNLPVPVKVPPAPLLQIQVQWKRYLNYVWHENREKVKFSSHLKSVSTRAESHKSGKMCMQKVG